MYAPGKRYTVGLTSAAPCPLFFPLTEHKSTEIAWPSCTVLRLGMARLGRATCHPCFPSSEQQVKPQRNRIGQNERRHVYLAWISSYRRPADRTAISGCRSIWKPPSFPALARTVWCQLASCPCSHHCFQKIKSRNWEKQTTNKFHPGRPLNAVTR